jgi:hypothetical protein
MTSSTLAMSCATKAKAVAGEAAEGDAVVDKMASLDRVAGGQNLQIPKFFSNWAVNSVFQKIIESDGACFHACKRFLAGGLGKC